MGTALLKVKQLGFLLVLLLAFNHASNAETTKPVWTFIGGFGDWYAYLFHPNAISPRLCAYQKAITLSDLMKVTLSIKLLDKKTQIFLDPILTKLKSYCGRCVSLKILNSVSKMRNQICNVFKRRAHWPHRPMGLACRQQGRLSICRQQNN